MDIKQASRKEIEALENHSSIIQTLAFFWSISLGFGLILLFLAISGAIGFSEALPVIILLLPWGIVGIGFYIRATWARYCGLLLCYLSLLAIPVGTVIGILGLKALRGSPQLFGRNPPKHQEIKEALARFKNMSEQATTQRVYRDRGTEGLSNREENKSVKCPTCRKELREIQTKQMIGNEEYNDWCRDGYYSKECFDIAGNGSA